jgi:hypothetical protein
MLLLAADLDIAVPRVVAVGSAAGGGALLVTQVPGGLELAADVTGQRRSIG